MKHSATLKHFLLLLGGAALGVVLPASAQTAAPIIARARAYLGSDAALSSVTSVHFSGYMEQGNAEPDKPQSSKVSIEIIFQKPYQQRIEANGAEMADTTALDGYAAWQQTMDLKDPSRWKLSVLGPDQIKRLRANTWENLNFFKDIEKRGGAVEFLGPATVDRQPAVKLAFRHDAGIVFYRYFDPESGRLLLTETEQNGSIREEGEIMVNGLRFPQKVTQTLKGVDAKGRPVEQKLVIIFDRITLNEAFPESIFEMPLTGPSSTPPRPNTPALPPVNQQGKPQASSPPAVSATSDVTEK
jgi:outer membrane lipoprotein-sorting protein